LLLGLEPWAEHDHETTEHKYELLTVSQYRPRRTPGMSVTARFRRLAGMADP
jgi:hypothetical protein